MRGRFAAATGLIFVVLAAAAFLVGGETPDADASAREAVEYYTENDGQIFMASILLAWAAVFFLFFAGTLRAGL